MYYDATVIYKKNIGIKLHQNINDIVVTARYISISKIKAAYEYVDYFITNIKEKKHFHFLNHQYRQ